jgi:hypothetical protein
LVRKMNFCCEKQQAEVPTLSNSGAFLQLKARVRL